MTDAVELETRLGSLRVHRQAAWVTRCPDLAQGITGRTSRNDFGSPTAAGGSAASQTAAGWSALQRATGIPRVARCRQVHGATVISVDRPEAEGLHVLGEADALVTDRAGVLLTVTVADCVPVYFVDPGRRALGLAHAGWRGTAAGVVGATLARMWDLGSSADEIQVHLGPAICGKCYEVGPEVTAALGLAPAERSYVDLRERIALQVAAAGVGVDRLTVSSGCTRCNRGRFYSYRGGDRGRRMCAYLGWVAG
jgi:YfiH family protein